MNVHEVKCIEPYYQDIKNNIKKFELRWDDRHYQVGDCLHEMQYVNEQLTGASIYVYVTSILRNFPGLEPGYCIMSIERQPKK